MKFETVRIHLFGLFHPEILIPWQCDLTTSPLYFLTHFLKVPWACLHGGGGPQVGDVIRLSI